MPNETELGWLSYPDKGDRLWYEDAEEWFRMIELLGIPTYESESNLPDAGDPSTEGVQRQFAAVRDDAIIYRVSGDQTEWVPWAYGQGADPEFGSATLEAATIDGLPARRTLDSDTTVTVGSGADYDTLSDAIEDLSNDHPKYQDEGINVEIELQSGYELDESIRVSGIDLGWLRITGEDSETTIISEELNGAAFLAADGATLPQIDQLFWMDDSGEEGRFSGIHGIRCQDGGSVIVHEDAGVTNANENGLECIRNSEAEASGADFSDATVYCVAAIRNSRINAVNVDASGSQGDSGLGRNLYAARGSVLVANGATADDAYERGIYAARGALIHAANATARNAGDAGVECEKSRIDFDNGDARKDPPGETEEDMIVRSGGTIHAQGAEGGTNIPKNIFIENGVINDQTANSPGTWITIDTSDGEVTGDETLDLQFDEDFGEYDHYRFKYVIYAAGHVSGNAALEMTFNDDSTLDYWYNYKEVTAETQVDDADGIEFGWGSTYGVTGAIEFAFRGGDDRLGRAGLDINEGHNGSDGRVATEIGVEEPTVSINTVEIDWNDDVDGQSDYRLSSWIFQGMHTEH